jgi:hypothetical protein
VGSCGAASPFLSLSGGARQSLPSYFFFLRHLIGADVLPPCLLTGDASLRGRRFVLELHPKIGPDL